MALNLFAALMPKEADFIDLFCRHSEKILAAAGELRQILAEDGRLDEHVAAIRRLEAEADGFARRLFVAANRTFNAPIDRENILGLTHDLDDVIDLIEDTAIGIRRYQLRAFSEEMKAMADAVLHSVELLQKAIPLLAAITRKFEAILDLCQRVGQIEGEADDCLEAGLTALRAELRAGAIDTITYLDRKEIYDLLERVVDKCDDVANALETITAKHV
ncbi:MAG TPA: DUF47 family protein [Stellaceae bacterium]|nr:DUF47 family protein [Stellaceae bacterium]